MRELYEEAGVRNGKCPADLRRETSGLICTGSDEQVTITLIDEDRITGRLV